MKDDSDIDDITRSMVDEYVGMVGISVKHTQPSTTLAVPDMYQTSVNQKKKKSSVDGQESVDDYAYVLMTDVNTKSGHQ